MTKPATPAALTDFLMTRIASMEPLVPVVHEEGVYKTLHSPVTGERIGDIQVFNGSLLLDKVIRVHIHQPAINLEAYMIAAFTKPELLYPHLMYDCESLPEDSAFHIDLIHKQDISTDIAYIEAVLEPLSPAFEAAQANPHFRFSEATRLMKAMLNPWMASYHCNHEHLVESYDTIAAYVNYWLSLVDTNTTGIDFSNTSSGKIADYDYRHRQAIYNPKVDILWDALTGIIGNEARDEILAMLQNNKQAQ